MRLPRRAAPALLAAAVVAAGACGGPPARETTLAPSPAAGPPAFAGAIPLAPGLLLTLVPYLPGVDGEDVPDLARREVEVLEVEKEGCA